MAINWTSIRSSTILTICPQCQIPLLTANSNKGRGDIRCPFGCRQQHKKEQSNKRSKEYYQTSEGQQKKQRLNQNRKKEGLSHANVPPTPSLIIKYMQLILSSIWNVHICLSEVSGYYNSVCEKMRQHPLYKTSDKRILIYYE